MNHEELAYLIRRESNRIPLGGSIRIKGSEPISGYNFAEAVARIIEKAGSGHDIYSRLCDQPERSIDLPASDGRGR